MKLTRTDDHIHHFFSASVEPVVTIDPGDRIVVETRDASNGQIRSGRKAPVDRTRLLPATGPIAVRGARSGDAVSIHIERIHLGKTGYAWIRPGLGIRQIQTEGPYYVRDITVTDNGVLLGHGVHIPLRPMVGIVGVGTLKDISTRIPGIHGGNLDCVDLSPGNTLWLPVLLPEAHVSFGDVHAAMGEGEVSGTGVEIEAEVTAIIDLHPNGTLSGPVIVTPQKTVFLSSSPDLLQAAKSALDRAIQALIERNGISESDAYITASIAGNLRICQLVNGDSTISFELPREVLEW